MIIPYGETTPTLGNNVFVAPDAWIIGNVDLGDQVSVFFGSVLRGDILPITVGRGSNIQEHSMLHTSHDRMPTIIGEDVTIGHRAIVHGATVGNRCIIGMGAILLDDAVVEDDCIIGAGALITSNTHIPAGSMAMGIPAKVVRSLTEEERSFLKQSAINYVETGKQYLEMNLGNLLSKKDHP